MRSNINSFIFLGDNVYGDTENNKLDLLINAYEMQKKKIPNWLFEKDIYAIWDDHDYGVNDGGKEYKLKYESEELYESFWSFDHDDLRKKIDGTYFSNIIEIDNKTRVKIIGLDTRFFRDNPSKSNQDNNKKSILGKEQWMWLKNEFKEDADIIFLLSSIQVLPEDHRFEKWSNFPKERERLLDNIKKSNKKIIILSGDRHRAAIYEHDGVTEITSSSLNKPITMFDKYKFLNYLPTSIRDFLLRENDSKQIGKTIIDSNYGLISINSEERIIKAYIKDELGNNRKEILIKF